VNKLKFLLAVLMLVLVAGCSHTMKSNNESEAVLAVLSDYRVNNGFITIDILSKGCTFYNSFKVQASEVSSNMLEVVRVNTDKCSMKPRKVALTYSFRHTGIALDKKVHVRNQLNRPSDGNILAK